MFWDQERNTRRFLLEPRNRGCMIPYDHGRLCHNLMRALFEVFKAGMYVHRFIMIHARLLMHAHARFLDKRRDRNTLL